ncbi:MAG: OmpA family protein [Bacteroidetes bacterium]|nr:OmpA family protein [Bacteroidota bacterium]
MKGIYKIISFCFLKRMLSISLSVIVSVLYFQPVRSQSLLPQNLGPGINTAYDEINPVLSADGKTLFFTRVNHPENTFGSYDSEDIWYSELQGGKWSEAKRLPQLNIWRYNSVLSISKDGKTLLINGIYNKRGNFWKKRGLSVSIKNGEEWSAPVRLKVKDYSNENRGMKSNGFMSADGQYLLLSFSKKYNAEKTDLYYSKKIREGKWSSPKKLRKVNSGRNEEAPFLSADNKTLYFSSNRKGGKKNFDIYKTQPQSDNWKRWSKPVLLSDTINSEEWESYYKINSDGKAALFSSTKNSLGRADIFKIEFPETNPVVLIAGKVINGKTNKPLSAGLQYQIFINDRLVDSLKVNPDSATYQVRLPLGKSYSLKAVVKNYNSRAETVDVASKKQFTSIKRNLIVEPLSYVLVKGKLLMKGTNEIISAAANARVLINGSPADSVKIDPVSTTYSVKLDYSKKYRLMVNGTSLIPIPADLDLSSETDYKEIELDLYADLEKAPTEPVAERPVEVKTEPIKVKKFATITGRIIDKKTGDPFPPGSKLQVKVMGSPLQTEARIDPQTSRYELSLPFGESYVIGATAANYYPVSERIDLTNDQSETSIVKDLYLARVEAGGSVRLNNVLFELGKSVLKRESYKELDRIVEFLIENPSVKIEIGGHTDNVGSAELNLRLSLARAQTVSHYLVSKRIAKNRVSVRVYGLTKPITTNSTAQGRALNRRVEFKFLEL